VKAVANLGVTLARAISGAEGVTRCTKWRHGLSTGCLRGTVWQNQMLSECCADVSNEPAASTSYGNEGSSFSEIYQTARRHCHTQSHRRILVHLTGDVSGAARWRGPGRSFPRKSKLTHRNVAHKTCLLWNEAELRQRRKELVEPRGDWKFLNWWQLIFRCYGEWHCALGARLLTFQR